MDLIEIEKAELQEEMLDDVKEDRDLKKDYVINNLYEKLAILKELQEKKCKKTSEGTAENVKEEI